MAELGKLEKEMKKAYEDKQEELGENDSELAAKKMQLNSAKEAAKSSQDFLDELRPTCETKSKEFKARKLLRANEEVAIAQAVSILNDGTFAAADAAPEAMAGGEQGELYMGDGGNFLQLKMEHQQAQMPTQAEATVLAQRVLRQAGLQDARLARLASLLQADNPFSVVFGEIGKMLNLIDEEQEADEEKHDFCKKTDGWWREEAERGARGN